MVAARRPNPPEVGYFDHDLKYLQEEEATQAVQGASVKGLCVRAKVVALALYCDKVLAVGNLLRHLLACGREVRCRRTHTASAVDTV